MQLSFLFMRN